MATFDKTASISLSAVRSHFGKPTASAVALCSAANTGINKFAMFRPIIHPTLGNLTDAERKEKNFGWRVTSYSTLSALYGALTAGTAYSAELPDGSNSSSMARQPCRLGDFRGYEHGAAQWVAMPEDVAFDSTSKGVDFFAPRTIIPSEDSQDSLTWKHGAAFVGKYACVAWKVGDSWNFKTASSPISHRIAGGNVSMSVTLTREEMGLSSAHTEADVMLCLSSAKRDDVTSQMPSANFVGIPAEEPLTCKATYSHMVANIEISVVGVLGGADVYNVQADSLVVYKQAANYGGLSSATGPNAYLGVGQSPLAVLIAVKNTGTSAYSTYSTTMLTTQASVTLAGGTDVTSSHMMGVATAEHGVFKCSEPGYGSGGYSTQLTTCSKIEVAAGTTAYYMVKEPYLLAQKTTGGEAFALTTGARAETGITFILGDNYDTNVNGGIQLRVCQGSDASYSQGLELA